MPFHLHSISSLPPDLFPSSPHDTEDSTDFQQQWDWSDEEEEVEETVAQVKPAFSIGGVRCAVDGDGTRIAFILRDSISLFRTIDDTVVSSIPYNLDDLPSAVSLLGLAPSRRIERKQCLIVGYQSGFIRFFDEDGSLLFEERLHGKPVLRLRLRSSGPSWRHTSSDGVEALTVLFEGGTMAHIEGLSLYSTLRTCYYARDSEHTDQRPSLTYKKLRGADQYHTVDVAFRGPVRMGVLALSGASMTSDRFITAGSEPMLACYAADRQISTISAAVALASTVASKLTSAVFSFAKSWLVGQQGNEDERLARAKQRPEVLPIEAKLNDPTRGVLSLSLDPSGEYVAATDALGRVLLLQIANFAVIRMWKGYREAQCVWIEVARASPSPLQNPFALYLAIYAPRRCVVELYKMPMGKRAASIDVGSDCQLLSGVGDMGIPSDGTGDLARAFLLSKDGLSEIRMKEEKAQPIVEAVPSPVTAPHPDEALLVQLVEVLDGGAVASEDSIVTTIESMTDIKYQCAALWTVMDMVPRDAKLHLALTNTAIRLAHGQDVKLGEAIGEREPVMKADSSVTVSDYLHCRARAIAAYLGLFVGKEQLPVSPTEPSDDWRSQGVRFDAVHTESFLGQFLGDLAVSSDGRIKIGAMDRVSKLVYESGRVADIVESLELEDSDVVDSFYYWVFNSQGPVDDVLRVLITRSCACFIMDDSPVLASQVMLPLLHDKLLDETNTQRALELAAACLTVSIDPDLLDPYDDQPPASSLWLRPVWDALSARINDAEFVRTHLLIDTHATAASVALDDTVPRLIAMQQLSDVERDDKAEDDEMILARNFFVSQDIINIHRIHLSMQEHRDIDVLTRTLADCLALSTPKLTSCLSNYVLSFIKPVLVDALNAIDHHKPMPELGTLGSLVEKHASILMKLDLDLEQDIDTKMLPSDLPELVTLSSSSLHWYRSLALILHTLTSLHITDLSVPLMPLFPDQVTETVHEARIELVATLLQVGSHAFGPCLVLGRSFDIEDDTLVRRHVVWLYEHGRDTEAEEVARSVRDSEALGSVLLQVTRKRLAVIFSMMGGTARKEMIGNVPADVHDWINEALPLSSSDQELEGYKHSTAVSVHALAQRVAKWVGSKDASTAAGLITASRIVVEHE